jgi:glycosyltransferase involved in cell wall biosynthesis
MLDRALAAQPEMEHVRFSWPSALFTRIDVFHLHWPETLLGGDREWKRRTKRLLFRALLLKLRVSGTTIVRTAHNVELPQDVDGATRAILVLVEERADYRILLNPLTELPWTTASVVIPHGHYRDWFADVPPIRATDDSIGFVGLVRKYKGVDHLLSVFRETESAHPELRLLVAGNPTSTSLAEEVRAQAAKDPRVSLDLRFLSEADFAAAMMSVRGIVLPYRFMHNSGAALAALSLGRPVLVPQNPVNVELAKEVGDGWVYMYTGQMDHEDLIAFHRALSEHRPDAGPRLDRREWNLAGADHVRAYREAVRAHGEKRKRNRAR